MFVIYGAEWRFAAEKISVLLRLYNTLRVSILYLAILIEHCRKGQRHVGVLIEYTVMLYQLCLWFVEYAMTKEGETSGELFDWALLEGKMSGGRFDSAYLGFVEYAITINGFDWVLPGKCVHNINYFDPRKSLFVDPRRAFCHFSHWLCARVW